jgi:hypothetical protein
MSVSTRFVSLGSAVVLSLWSVAGVGVSSASAADDDAPQILKAMSDYLSSQKTISATFDSSLEVITTDLEKIQFNSSGTLLLSRPNKVHATRTGGYSDVELTFDGKVVTIYGKHINQYMQLDAPGSIDQMIDTLHSRGAAIPAADLLLSDVYDAVTADVVSVKHIGEGVIGGVECEHLAFRQPDVDWQIWIDKGPKPVPCKLVITSKAVSGSPEYTMLIRDWKTNVPADDAAFTFNAPTGSQKLELGEGLAKLDELPEAGATTKGK